MMAVSSHIDPATMKQFNELLTETVAVTGRDVRLQCRLNGRDFIKKSIKLTPIMQRNQDRMVAVADLSPASRSFFRALGIRYIPARALGMKPYTPKGRGFAKSGWLVALFGLGLRYQTVPGQLDGGRWREIGKFRDRLNATMPSVEIGNAAPFIETLNAQGGNEGQAHFFQTALEKTVRQMDYRLNYFAWQLSQRFGRGARMPKTFTRDAR